MIGLAFPSGARLLGVHREKGIDDLIRFKVEIPRNHWSAFERELPVKPDEMRPGAGRLGPDQGWWDPRAAVGLRSGQARRENARAINIGVTHTDRNTTLLYVVEHGT
jgi:hypothetical protein